ncbi:MAG TPA: ATP-binding protein [Vicinamibacterales bacterium]|nr:ATP-binding protein [Vicinamibacterales bacterium]
MAPLREIRSLPASPAIAGLLIGLIFWADIVLPAAVAVPMLYIIPTILFVSGSRLAEPLVVAATATVLTMVGFYASPDGGEGTDLPNRVIAVAVIWVAAGLVVAYVRRVDTWSARMRDTHEALESSMRRLQDIQYALDQSAIVAATDQTGKITYVNDKFCEISRYTREELIGQDHRLINSGYHPKEFIRTLWRTIAQGHVWRGELRNRAKDGSIYWVDTTIVPFLDERGKPWQYLAIRSDITQRKQAEEKLRDEAALTQMGRLSAVVAHEVRNPLAALKGSLQVLASRLPADLPGREIITPMLVRIDALNQTVKDILTYSKPNPPKLQRVALDRLVPEVVSTARAAMPKATIEVSGEPTVARADPEMIRAVLLNLLLNACHASDDAFVEVRTSVSDALCTVAILDRGPGLPAEVREHLFEPFITTRSGGTGLGLPIANRLTQQQGGTLTIEDRPGGGTVATVRLPTIEAPIEAPM